MKNLLLLIFSLILLHPASNAQQKQRPNIIFIFADDLGYGEIGCYGQQKIETPQIDKMAAAGIRFTRFYSGSTVCAPARPIDDPNRPASNAAASGQRTIAR